MIGGKARNDRTRNIISEWGVRGGANLTGPCESMLYLARGPQLPKKKKEKRCQCLLKPAIPPLTPIS